MRAAFLFLPMASLAVFAAASAPAPDLSWLAGYWLSCPEDGEVSETWSDQRGSVMLGTSFTLSKGRASWEFSRIGPSGDGISFFAQPGGQAPAEFRAVQIAGQRVVFENLDHDFPQRVIYARDGDRLVGRIEGTIEGAPRTAEWHYVAAKLNARCPMK